MTEQTPDHTETIAALSQKLIAAGVNPSPDFIVASAKCVAGFNAGPGEMIYDGSLHQLLFKLGVDKAALPADPKEWRDDGHKFLTLGRILIDPADREGVAAPFPLPVFNRIRSGEREMPKEGTLDRLQFDVAALYNDKVPASRELKAWAWGQLNELPDKFASYGFVGFAANLTVALARGTYQKAASWAAMLSNVSEETLLRVPPAEEKPAAAAPGGGGPGRGGDDKILKFPPVLRAEM